MIDRSEPVAKHCISKILLIAAVPYQLLLLLLLRLLKGRNKLNIPRASTATAYITPIEN